MPTDFAAAFRGVISFIESSLYKSLNGVYLLADSTPVSTSDLISSIKRVLNKKDLQFFMPIFAHKLVRSLLPGIYNKLLSDLIVDSKEAYKDAELKITTNLDIGLEEMVRFMNNR